jgi:hypothetical protein
MSYDKTNPDISKFAFMNTASFQNVARNRKELLTGQLFYSSLSQSKGNDIF